MIFTPEHCKKILAGQKTQTRRLVKKGDGWVFDAAPLGPYEADIDPHQIGMGHPVDAVFSEYRAREKWRVGRDYAIQPGRGKKSVGRFRITGIRRERLQDISSQDAIAEGATLIFAGLDAENRILLDGPLSPTVEEYRGVWNTINKCPGTRWEDNPEVWVLEFELV